MDRIWCIFLFIFLILALLFSERIVIKLNFSATPKLRVKYCLLSSCLISLPFLSNVRELFFIVSYLFFTCCNFSLILSLNYELLFAWLLKGNSSKRLLLLFFNIRRSYRLANFLIFLSRWEMVCPPWQIISQFHHNWRQIAKIEWNLQFNGIF